MKTSELIAIETLAQLILKDPKSPKTALYAQQIADKVNANLSPRFPSLTASALAFKRKVVW